MFMVQFLFYNICEKNICLFRANHDLSTGEMNIPSLPGPWRLDVKHCFIFPFLSTPRKVEKLLRVPRDRQDNISGIGMAMFIKYSSSPAGAYDELIYGMPFSSPTLPSWRLFSPRRLPVIYVSGESTLRNGRENWGIRKELGDFYWTTSEGYFVTTTTFIARDRLSGKLITSASFATLNIPFILPLNWFGSLSPPIVERKIDVDGKDLEEGWLQVVLGGFGWARFSMVTRYQLCDEEAIAPSLFNLGAFVGLSYTGHFIFPKGLAISN
jgi:hypothetical protein